MQCIDEYASFYAPTQPIGDMGIEICTSHLPHALMESEFRPALQLLQTVLDEGNSRVFYQNILVLLSYVGGKFLLFFQFSAKPLYPHFKSDGCDINYKCSAKPGRWFSR